MAAVTQAGLHAIGEMIFKGDHHVEAFEEALSGDRLLVRLVASSEVCLARERARKDRPAGTARQTAAVEVVPPTCDLTVDTSHIDVPAVATAILEALTRPQ